MTTIHKVGNKYRIITKGAPDVLLSKCIKIYQNGETKMIGLAEKEVVLNRNSNMADKALRVLGVAYQEVENLPNQINIETIEKDLIFVRTNAE